MVEWCHQNMAAYKAPRIVEFVDALPKSGTGKIMWRALQEQEAALCPASDRRLTRLVLNEAAVCLARRRPGGPGSYIIPFQGTSQRSRRRISMSNR